MCTSHSERCFAVEHERHGANGAIEPYLANPRLSLRQPFRVHPHPRDPKTAHGFPLPQYTPLYFYRGHSRRQPRRSRNYNGRLSRKRSKVRGSKEGNDSSLEARQTPFPGSLFLCSGFRRLRASSEQPELRRRALKGEFQATAEPQDHRGSRVRSTLRAQPQGLVGAPSHACARPRNTTDFIACRRGSVGAAGDPMMMSGLRATTSSAVTMRSFADFLPA